MNMYSEKPYERFMMSGAGSLTNAELLAIILRTGTKGVSAVELGRRVLDLHDPDTNALSYLSHLIDPRDRRSQGGKAAMPFRDRPQDRQRESPQSAPL